MNSRSLVVSCLSTCRVSGIGNDGQKVKSCWSKSEYEYGLTRGTLVCRPLEDNEQEPPALQALMDEFRSQFCCSDIRMTAALVADEFIRKGNE